MRRILQILLDPTNHPVLVHCNKGKVSLSPPTEKFVTRTNRIIQHRTGCVIACLRKAQNWPPADVIAEYRKYSYPKNRSLDENFILDFDISNVARLAYENDASSWSSSESGSALANSRLRRPSSAFGSSVML